MLSALKSIYQTIIVKTRLVTANLLVEPFDSAEMARSRLKDRKIIWSSNRQTKIFTMFYIHNWEEILLDELKKWAPTYHFTWTKAAHFFPTQQEWLEYREATSLRLLKEFEEFYQENCNILVFCYTSDFILSAKILEKLKRNNVIMTNFCWDDLLYFNGHFKGQTIGVKKIAKKVDFNLTMSPESIPLYQSIKTPCFFWQGKNLKTSDEIELPFSISSEFYVLFIGSKYGRRSQFIQNLQKAGIKVLCFGHGWDNGPITKDQMIQEIQKAPITIGFANVGYTWNITTIKGRDFEVPLWGGLYLTQYSKGLTNYYQPDKDLYTYNNLNECIEKIYLIKNNPTKALSVRLNGMRIAKQKCTWHSRFAYLQDLIKTLTNESK